MGMIQIPKVVPTKHEPFLYNDVIKNLNSPSFFRVQHENNDFQEAPDVESKTDKDRPVEK